VLEELRRSIVRTSHVILILLTLATTAFVVPPWWTQSARHELFMTVWGMPFEDLLFRDTYARGYERQHPDIRVRYQRYVDVRPKYEAWHAVGRGADVMRMGIDVYYALAAKGMLAPLDAYINDPQVGLTPEEQADFFPWVWNALVIDGHRYALPSDNAQYGVYYNKRIFDAYNAAHPDAPLTYPSAAWTWDDLRRANRLLTVRTAAGTSQHGVSFELWAWPFLAFFVQAGGQVWDADQTTALVNSPAGVQALELIAELIPQDAPLRNVELAESASGPDDLFKIGKLAILLDGSWRAPDIERESPGLEFAIAPLPHGAQAAVISGSVVWAVSVHSPNPAQAWEMVKWLTRREQSLAYWDKLRVAPPALRSVVASPEFEATRGVVTEDGGRVEVLVPPMSRAQFAARGAWLQYALTPDAQTGRMPGLIVVAPYETDLELKLSRAEVEVVLGQKTAQQALDDVVRETHAIIDRDRAAKGLPAVVRPR
jgi:multiple sugar transport system substrate-binding protein